MRAVRLPPGHRFEPLQRRHARRAFSSGEPSVDDWLKTKALQHQQKHLSSTKVLLDSAGAIAGYFTLATGQVDFADLSSEMVRRLPRRSLPVAVLAWLGVERTRHGEGLGDLLLAQALRDCYEAGQVFPFIAVILDCVSDAAKSFYARWDFEELPGQPHRLFLSATELEDILESTL